MSKQEGEATDNAVMSRDSHVIPLAGDASGSDKENNDADRLRCKLEY